MTVQTLIFFEIIIVLVTLCLLLLLYALKQRELRQRVLQEYRKLRQICLNEDIPIDEPGIDLAPTQPAIDPVAVFLEQAHHQAQTRYLQLTQATVPRLAPELPYGSKIAALRFIYAMAELYAYQHPPGSQAHWLALERKLVDVARWIGQEGRHQKPQINHRLRLLQERIDALKPFEQESIRLQRQLTLARGRQKKLELAHNESQRTIMNLQQRLRSLRHAHGGNQETPAQFQQRFRHYGSQDHIRDAKESFTSTMSQADTITAISNQKNLLLKNIAASLSTSYTDMAPAQRKRLEDAIKSLEKDVLKSDHHIANLQRELKQTRDSLIQQPLVVTAKPAAASKNTPAQESDSTALSAADKAEHIENVLKVIHTNLAQGEQALADEIRVRDPASHQRTLAEIQQLRLNNQSQRNMIIDLEKELQALRRESLEAEDEAVSKEKNEDIARLEHLVKECEYCIETLESQVDLLHLQLEEGYAKQAAEASRDIDPDILKINDELETVSKKLKDTLKQYQHSAIINRFALEIVQCHSVEAIARRLIQSIKDLQVTAGFTLHSILGDAEFFTGNLFNQEEKARLKSAASTSNIRYLNDSILFANSHVHLLLKNPPINDEEQVSEEATLTGLIDLASERLESLEAKTQHRAQEKHLGAWLGTTKDQLAELNLQRVNQAEESRHVMENLMAELRRATEMIEMSPRARAVFDNAINECHQRMEIILEGGSELDRTFSGVLADLERINRNKKATVSHHKMPKLPR